MSNGKELHEEARQLIRPVTLAEVKELLEEANENFQELSYEQKLALKHAQEFSKLSREKAVELMKELTGISIINDITACKIADIMPDHPDDIHLLFTKQRTQLTAEDITTILEIVDKYREE